MEKHVEQQITALFERNVVIYLSKEFLCFIEPHEALLFFALYFSQSHRIS